MNRLSFPALLLSAALLLLSGCHGHDDHTKSTSTEESTPPQASSSTNTPSQPQEPTPPPKPVQPHESNASAPTNEHSTTKAARSTRREENVRKSSSHPREHETRKSQKDLCAKSNWTRVACKNGDNACVAHQIDLIGQYERCKKEGKLH